MLTGHPPAGATPARPLRVLWLGHFLPYPPQGGALQRSHHLLRQAATRHEVHLVSLSQRAILPAQEDIEEAETALRAHAASVASIRIPADWSHLARAAVLVRGFVGPAPYDVQWLRAVPMQRRLEAISATGPFDLVHVDTIGLWPYLDFLPPTPVALNHHNVESQMMARRADLEPRRLARAYFRRQAMLLRRLEAAAVPKAAANLVVSDLDAERLRATCPDGTIRVVANGVDTEFFRPGRDRPPEPGSLVFAGRMSWYPNHEAARWFLREVWPLLRRRGPSYRLTFVGKSPPADLSAAATDGVSVTGYVPDVRPFLERAAIYVCPIRNGGGTRLKVLDALAMAKPLVATGLAMEGLDLREDEHYLRAETPDEFVHRIEALVADPAAAQALGERGREQVERLYSWAVVGHHLDDAWRHAARGTPARTTA